MNKSRVTSCVDDGTLLLCLHKWQSWKPTGPISNQCFKPTQTSEPHATTGWLMWWITQLQSLNFRDDTTFFGLFVIASWGRTNVNCLSLLATVAYWGCKNVSVFKKQEHDETLCSHNINNVQKKWNSSGKHKACAENTPFWKSALCDVTNALVSPW